MIDVKLGYWSLSPLSVILGIFNKEEALAVRAFSDPITVNVKLREGWLTAQLWTWRLTVPGRLETECWRQTA